MMFLLWLGRSMFFYESSLHKFHNLLIAIFTECEFAYLVRENNVGFP
ncbi:hypothetical protein HMPREF9455_01692 [Dysgonomonas gadei ATCC BAA-286]|uniref:Uncharacterized protein n=1 Tax=Dysgonomonas gadei ATCC BAA-286 TaxID=742766 RepID=F5IX75_9BACT|nr:hypothetical protein HMPREF9455_01692 [Dysgonomonas gadei ATCC BAA-286]